MSAGVVFGRFLVFATAFDWITVGSLDDAVGDSFPTGGIRLGELAEEAEERMREQGND